jgi:uncharacterized lipoprotein
MMKRITWLALASFVALAAAGCASDRGYRGGTSDSFDRDYGTAGPTASPTFRPGMNPRDIRDPNALTRPLPPAETSP